MRFATVNVVFWAVMLMVGIATRMNRVGGFFVVTMLTVSIGGYAIAKVICKAKHDREQLRQLSFCFWPEEAGIPMPSKPLEMPVVPFHERQPDLTTRMDYRAWAAKVINAR